jgi:DNA uptake protein ComE-like DNA-binding protein
MHSHRRIALAIAALLLVLGIAPSAFAAAKEKKKADKQEQSQDKSKEKVDVNTASQADLEALPGVGEATAKKIIDNRPFKSVADLRRAGISDTTLSKIRPLVKASRSSSAESASESTQPASRQEGKSDQAADKKESGKSESQDKPQSSSAKSSGNVDLNSASQSELEALPGVGAVTAKKIIAGRPYSSVDDLSKAGVSAKTIEKIRGSVTAKGNASAQESSSGASSSRAGGASNTEPSSTESSSQESSRTSETDNRNTARTSGMPQSDTSSAAPGGGNGQVWVNTDTKIYHYEGDHWYGKTKHGKYMSEADAKNAGYRAAKNEKPKE